MPAKDKDKRILESAQREFALKGFHATVVSDIASAAGVGKGTVYRRFGNKDQLFSTLVKRGSDELLEGIEAAVHSHGSPLQILEQCLDVYFHFFHHSRELMEIVFMEGKQRIGRVHHELMQNDARIRGHLSELFSSGIQQGLFRSLDPDYLALLLHNTLWSLMRWAILFNEPIETTRPLLLDVYLHGIQHTLDSSPTQQ